MIKSINMRAVFASLLVVVSTMTSLAQMPQWVIAPANDTLYVKVDDALLQSAKDGKSIIWTMDGRQLYSTENIILPFKDGVATVCQPNQPIITGFIDNDGKFTDLPNMKISYDNPYFEDGYILGYVDDQLAYYKKDGSRADFPAVINSYPFHKGYAPFFTYMQMEKKKDPHYGYFKADGTTLEYITLDDASSKTIDPKDVNFLSGISSTGQGVAVVKNKLYWFDAVSETFKPLLWGEEESVKKRHLNISDNFEQYLQNLPQDTVVIWAKYGKNKYAELKFDKELRPVKFFFDGEEMSFIEEPAQKMVYKTNVSGYENNGKYGLALNSKNVLPAQFESVGLKYGNRAFVKTDNKWGIIEIIPDLDFTLKLNKGEDVAFRHQKYETQIRLDLPAQISSKEARIDIPEETGCVIDKTSRATKDTESGNFVIYDCVLNIPSSLPDTITVINYQPVKVSYEGISLYERPISIKGWHYKYYNVDPIESETSISNGVASFTINIVKEGESDYPFDVRIEADSISVEYEKISETRYKCLVSNLQEGDNYLNILVTEKGCPSSAFPFEIFYTKPIPKKTEKEEVVIRKKDPVIKRQTPRLEL